MRALYAFLKPFRVKTAANLVRLPSGKWLVPEEKADEFWELYSDATIPDGIAFVPQPQGRMPNVEVIDLDWRLGEETTIPRQMYMQFIEALVQRLDAKKEYTVVLCEPERSTYVMQAKAKRKTPDPEVGKVWKGGVHIFIKHEDPVSQSYCMAFRKANMYLIPEIFGGLPHVDDNLQDAWDEAPCLRHNGVTIFGGTKPKGWGGHGGPKKPVFVGVVRKNKFDESMDESEADQLIVEQGKAGILNKLYGPLMWGPTDETYTGKGRKRKLKPKPKKPRKKQKKNPTGEDDEKVDEEGEAQPGAQPARPKVRIENEDGFQLHAFATWCTKIKYVPKYEDWKTLVGYVASCGFDPGGQDAQRCLGLRRHGERGSHPEDPGRL